MTNASRLKYLYLALASLIVLACGGEGGPSGFVVDKHITCHFFNTSATPVTFKWEEDPSFAQAVPAGGNSTNPGFSLQMTGNSIVTWHFSVSDAGGVVIQTGFYQWTTTAGENNNFLDVTYAADGSLSFHAETKR